LGGRFGAFVSGLEIPFPGNGDRHRQRRGSNAIMLLLSSATFERRMIGHDGCGSNEPLLLRPGDRQLALPHGVRPMSCSCSAHEYGKPLKSLETVRSGRGGAADDGIQSAGPVGMVSIAKQLNDRGIRTQRGGRWHVSSVANLLARANKFAEV
jgi:Recombinase